MLLVLATIPSRGVAILYILVFGLGSIGGMMLMSLLIGLPFHIAEGRFRRGELLLRAASGLFSIGFGLFMAYDIGIVDGLFGI